MNTYLIWFYFILATIITQINIFNVLIAIVSDSYARITAQKDCYALQQRTKIFADFIDFVRINSLMNNNRFLYIMEPIDVDVEDAPEDQSEQIEELKKLLKK